MKKIKCIIQLIRPEQWLKNLFIFLPMFFGRDLLNAATWQSCIIAFFAFSFASSGIYCLNDIKDADRDRKHPKKCTRPIASGAVTKPQGFVLMLVCWAISAGLLWMDYSVLDHPTFGYWIVITYVVMNLAYTFGLKNQSILDVFIIAIGFVLRVWYGGVQSGIFTSKWIISMTFLLALFLALAKRRDDVILYEKTGTKARKNVDRYSLDFLNQAITIIASITMVCYMMYTVSDAAVLNTGNHYVYITSIFVLAGIIKYLQLSMVDAKTGDPTKVLLKNRFIQLCVVGWFLTYFIIIYLL